MLRSSSSLPALPKPTSISAWFNEEQGQYEEAIPSFQKALALKPHLHGANLFLGITEFRLNHLDSAHNAVPKKPSAIPKTRPPGCGWE